MCQASNALLFCRADAAYLCMQCDLKVHDANKLASRHERVLLCEVCELAPAVFTCKADAAALCASCDVDIHSANPLACRHERVPVTPFSQSKLAHMNVVVPSIGDDDDDDDMCAAEAASWLLTHPKLPSDELLKTVKEEVTSSLEDGNLSAGEETMMHKEDLYSVGFLPEVDPYLGLDYASVLRGSRVPDSGAHLHASDLVVHASPVPSNGSGSMESERPRKDGYSYAATSLRHSLSSSSMDVGVVPDVMQSDLPTPKMHGIPPVGQVESMAREARVLRYKEKRKNRKFEKTIRYASRKAYAETRPRVKGRFAKRSEDAPEQLHFLVPDTEFVVPSC